jgi:hypothetical protein
MNMFLRLRDWRGIWTKTNTQNVVLIASMRKIACGEQMGGAIDHRDGNVFEIRRKRSNRINNTTRVRLRRER